jgi:DNA-binding NarL/FixJ family response regulator
VIRVLLADDQTLVRAGFRVLAGSAPDIEVVGEAADGAAAVSLAGSLRAEVVLMDIRMPGTDGLEATRQIAADPQLSGVRVIILTTFEADEYVFEAIRAGASGFLVRTPSRRTSSAPSGWSPAAMPCYRRASPAR